MTIDPTTDQKLLRRLQVEQAERRLPSVSAAVVRAGRTVWTGGAGRVDGKVPTTDTQYRIGSVTKTFIAVAVTRLRDAGLLALEEPVTGHLGPEWKVAALQNVSVGQLLMHTGGLPAETSGPFWNTVDALHGTRPAPRRS